MAYYSFRLDNAYPAIRQALDDFYEVRIRDDPAGRSGANRGGPAKAIQQFLLAALSAKTHIPTTERQAKDWLTRLLASVDPRRGGLGRALQAEQTGNWESLARPSRRADCGASAAVRSVAFG